MSNPPTRRLNRLRALIVLSLTLASTVSPSLSMAQTLSSGPTVSTDKQDYPPYSYVDITGTGFQPGETVSNRVVQVAGPNPGTAYDAWEVVADTNGNFITGWFVFSDELIGATLELTATGERSALSARAQFSDAPGFNAELQGQSFANTNWMNGNVTNWQELDLIPVRVYMTASALTANVSNQTITVSFDHTKTTGNSIIPGFENLYNFTPSASVIMVSPPTLTTSSGDVWTYTFVVTLTDTNGFVEFRARMSAGAHQFTGSSLSLSGTPSLGQMQIHVPQPTGGNPDLGVVKTGPAFVNPGQVITYSLSYTNNTNSVAVGAQLTDHLPAAVSFVSCSGGCSVLGNTVTWDLGDVQRASGGTVTYRVTVDPAALNGSTFQNNAIIASSQNDPNPTNNQSVVTTTVINGCIPPTIAGGPANVIACAGGSAIFSVAANGSSNLVYRWRKGGSNLSDGGNLSGTASATLTVNPVSSADLGNYDVVVTNSCGTNASTQAALSLHPAPTITCPGDISVSSDPVLCGTNVSFAATSTDPAATITYSQNPASFFPVGTNIVTAIASNQCGTISCSFTVTVADATSPLVTLLGANPLTNECHTAFVDPGATASDNCPGPLGVVTNSTVNPNATGVYTISYSATDASGNVGTNTRTVYVVDTTPPAVTVLGANPLTNECHTAFVDPGATASDTCAGPLVVVTNSTVNPNATGIYTLSYSATDPSGNASTNTRTVYVVDTTPPAVTVLGANPLTNECHTAFVDPGATANDTCAGPLAVVTNSTVNPNATGVYTIDYSATDPSGNASTNTRTVYVVDTTPPAVTVLGANPLTNECHTVFVDPGATANDSCAGPLAVVTNSTVNPNATGVYTIDYSATDPSGNASTNTRTVYVVDTTPPAVTVLGANPLTNECHTAFVDPGATASDTCAGPLVVVTNSTNPNATGIYTISYSATDPSGNASTNTRTVYVVDTTPPAVTVLGTNPLTNECHTAFVDSGATANDTCAGPLVVVTNSTVNPNATGVYTIDYSATDPSGNASTNTRTVYVVDTTPPTLGTCPAGGPFLLNSGLHTITNTASDICCLDPSNSVLIGTIDTASIGGKTVTFSAVDCSGNSVTQSCVYQVIAATNCLFDSQPGRAILPPIHSDGSSIFKQGSTVPAKFRVLDANCNSVGTPGLVTNFHLIKIVSGTVTNIVDQAVVSTTPFTVFRWDSTDQQWIFNINTKPLAPRATYYYEIKLNDGNSIFFSFGLKSANGNPSPKLLPPIAADGSSVFPQGTAVAASFQAFDVLGNSVGTPGLVTKFHLIKVVSGTTTNVVDQAVISTMAYTAFRWDSAFQQWNFNINTKQLAPRATYYYEIKLNDGTSIFFSFGLKSANGNPRPKLLPPIAADGSSVFPQGTAVAASFQAFDVLGNSVGTPGLVTKFHLIKVVSGTTTNVVDQAVISTMAYTAFRWDSAFQQWNFNINTKQLAPRATYYYEIKLNDGASVLFNFTLK